MMGTGLIAGAGAKAQLTTLPQQGPYRIVSLSDGGEDESARLATLLGAVPDGTTVEVRGRWLLGSRVELRGRRDVTIDGRGATITLKVQNWSDPAAMVVRDCRRITVHGIVFACNGAAFVSAGLADKAPTALAVISTAASAGADQRRSGDIEINCTFLDMAQRGLGIRLTDDVRVRGRFRGRARAATSFCDIARCDRVDLIPDSASDMPYTALGGSDYVISPGTFYASPGEAEFSFAAAINWCGLTHYEQPFEATAPIGTSEWLLDFGGGDATLPQGHDYAGNDWFFTCIDDAGAEDITTEQLHVSVASGDKRAVISLVDLDGTSPRKFRGQRFRITSIAATRFCRAIRVHDGTIRNSAGAGVMLMGCDGISVVNLVAENCFDYGIDLEWAINASITGNTIHNTIRTNGGIGVLFFFRTVAVTGNVISNVVNSDAAISAFGSGQANAGLAITGNIIDGGAIRLGLTDQAWFTGENITIEGNSIRHATVAVFVRGAPDRQACARGVRIAQCRFTAIGQQPIVLLSVTDVTIVDNDVQGTLYRGLCNIEGRAGLNRRIHIADCVIRGGGYNWTGLPVVLYKGPAAAAPTITQHNNWIADEDLAVGVDRPFYQADGGVELPALKRGEFRVASVDRSINPGATVGFEVTMPHVRVGQPLSAVLLTASADWAVSAAVPRSGMAQISVTNRSSISRRLEGGISIYPA